MSLLHLHDLHPAEGSTHKAKRLGQGPGSGKGKTAGKGHKGDKARAGGGVRPGFEGGQMPMTRRTPKRGFNNARFAKHFQIVNLDKIYNAFEQGDVTPAKLLEAGLIKNLRTPVKILADVRENTSPKPLKVVAHSFSKNAVSKIQADGGSISTEV